MKTLLIALTLLATGCSSYPVQPGGGLLQQLGLGQDLAERFHQGIAQSSTQPVIVQPAPVDRIRSYTMTDAHGVQRNCIDYGYTVQC